MFTGPMLEASEKVVEWPDVDEETFVRLIEFAYSGEYTLPMPDRNTTEDMGEESGSEEEDSTMMGEERIIGPESARNKSVVQTAVRNTARVFT